MRSKIGQKFIGIMALFVALMLVPASASAYRVVQTVLRFSAVAAETLATGNVVMLKDADGLAYKADANDAALRPAIGIIGKGGATGATVEIIVIGRLSGWSALSEGAPGYLSETAAAITQSAPAYSQQLGQAITATDYLVNFQNYFDSSSLTVLGTLSGAAPLVLEGATANDFETSVTVIDPTADRTVYVPDATGTVVLSAGATDEAATSFKGVANGIQFEGATANDFETTFDVADPTADVTYRLPVAGAGTYSLMSSTLATNAPDIANSVTGGTNQLIFEGTADAIETIVTATDPTVGDQTFTLPNLAANSTVSLMVSSLATNAPEAASSVTGGTSQLIFEGTTADAHEAIITATDPTVGDQTWTLPDLAANSTVAVMATTLATNAPDVANSVWGISNGLALGGATGGDGFELQLKPMGDPGADKNILFPVLNDAASMISTLTTNDVDVANSVWGVSNGLAFGGSTGADAVETKLTVTDPTVDRTVTIPNRTGQVQLASAASVLTPGAAVALTVDLSNIYTLETNDNEDTTITFSGAGTAGDEITIIFATGAGVVGDEIVTFHATLVSSVGTLTMANTASRFYVVRFVSDGSHWYEVSRTAIQT